jgi:cell division septation protein DedD
VEPAATTATTTSTAATEAATTAAAATATQAATTTASTASAATATTPVATATTPVATVATAPVAVVLDLPAKGNLTWYLQLAAYSTEAMARDTAARLTPTYPVLVLAPPAGSRPLYRVIVGPLNKAESGTLLARFRYSGFPDVFARAAN